MQIFYRLKIRAKVTIIASLSCLLVLLLTQSYTIYSGLENLEEQLEEQRKILLEAFDNNVKSEVQSAVSMAMGIYKSHQAGNITLEEAKKRIVEDIRNMRYGKDGYFWIDTYEGVNILMPVKVETEGKKRIDIQDTKGTYLIKEIIENGKKSDGGFTDYWFPKPGTTESYPKRSYSLAIAPLQWVVGTGNYIDDINKVVNEKEKVLRETFNANIAISIGLFFIGLLLSIIFSSLFAKTLSDPINDMVKRSRNLSAGDADLTLRIETSSSDEIGELAEAFNRFIERIQTLIDKTQHNSLQVNSATTEISAAIEELSTTVDGQNNQMQSIGYSASELNNTSRDITSSLESAQTTAEDSSTMTRNGDKIIRESIESLKEIEKQSKHLSSVIGNLENSTDQIGNIISVINDVADQTNLLALNAAIEAARAGEAGRGFAVVADEVRKLAERTGKATKEIETIIIGLQKESREASDAMTETSGEIVKGRELGEESLRILEQIVSSVENILQATTEISAAVTEENATIEEINSNISNITNSSEESTKAISEIAVTTEDLARQTEALQEMIGQFKTKK